MTSHVITGATGTLGAALTLELTERHPTHDIWLFTCPQPGGPQATRTHVLERLGKAAASLGRGHLGGKDSPLTNGQIRIMEGDLADPTLRLRARIPAIPDYVWHTAVCPLGGSWQRDDLTCTVHLMNLAEQWGTKNLVLHSSVLPLPPVGVEGEMPQPTQAGPWAQGKWKAETSCRTGYRFRPVAVRTGVVLGGSQTGGWVGEAPWWEAFQQMGPPPEGGVDEVRVGGVGHRVVPFVHADEAARMMVSAGMYGGQADVVHAVPAVAPTVAEVADRILRSAGWPVKAVFGEGECAHGARLGAVLALLGATDALPSRAAMFAATGDRTAVNSYGVEKCLRWGQRNLTV